VACRRAGNSQRDLAEKRRPVSDELAFVWGLYMARARNQAPTLEDMNDMDYWWLCCVIALYHHHSRPGKHSTLLR